MSDSPITPEAQEALEAWIGDALEEVTLPSGRQVKVRPGSLMELAVTGELPAPLMAVVLKEQGSSTTSLARNGIEITRMSIERSAAAVRAVLNGAGVWIPLRLDVGTFLQLPDADRTAISRIALGEEIAEVTASLAAFRDERGRPGDGHDGADVPPAALGAARPNRAARRSGASRSRQGARA